MVNQELVSPAIEQNCQESVQEDVESLSLKIFRENGFKHPCDRHSEPFACDGKCSEALQYELLRQKTQIEI